MHIDIASSKLELGCRAAEHGAGLIRARLARSASANIIVATGASQFEMLSHLVTTRDIDWSQVTCFHLDEYAGMPADHPASFRGYLKQRFVDLLPQPPAAFHYIEAENNLVAECERLAKLISPVEIDVAFIGIGENGHLAFNDPPANFETRSPYLVVELDEACRQQQFGEGWFPSLDAVPKQAISMSIRQILKSKAIVCSVPDARKARAVAQAVEGPLTPQLPASILRNHGRATLFIDEPAASQLTWRA